jgi:hypothetical protein
MRCSQDPVVVCEGIERFCGIDTCVWREVRHRVQDISANRTMQKRGYCLFNSRWILEILKQCFNIKPLSYEDEIRSGCLFHSQVWRGRLHN